MSVISARCNDNTAELMCEGLKALGIGHINVPELRSSGARCDDITAEASVCGSVHGCESFRGCHIDGEVFRV